MTSCSTKHVYTPRCNHLKCWDEYFRKNIGKAMAGRLLLKKFGAGAFELAKGTKFTKHLIRWVIQMEKDKNNGA